MQIVTENIIGKRIMDRRLEKTLIDRCPILFRDMYKSPQNTCMAFGIETGNGWFKLVYELSEKLESIISKMPLPGYREKDEIKETPFGTFTLPAGPMEDERPAASQVKEKFGRLSFYMTCATPEMYELIREAEKKSLTICEYCGKKGRLRRNSWWRTLCWWHNFTDKWGAGRGWLGYHIWNIKRIIKKFWQ